MGDDGSPMDKIGEVDWDCWISVLCSSIFY